MLVWNRVGNVVPFCSNQFVTTVFYVQYYLVYYYDEVVLWLNKANILFYFILFFGFESNNNTILISTLILHITIKQIFVPSTMVSTRRSRRAISTNPIVSSRKKPCHSTLDSQLKGYNGDLTTAQVSRDLLAQCFLSMRSSIWYRILPKNDDHDSISDGFGQKWESVLPLLCNSGLIKSKVVDYSLSFSIMRYQWENFCKSFTNDHGRLLHFSGYRQLKKKKNGLFALMSHNIRVLISK